MCKKLTIFIWVAISLSAQAALYPVGPLFGTGNTNNVLVKSTPFTITSNDFNPIVVSGAGTAAANGSYVLISSNLVAGLPYAVWSNSVSAANTYRLVYNNTNIVPSSIFSNFWTIENTINVNFAYDMSGPSIPFGTWEVSGAGGTPGAAPAPSIGTHQPDLITLSAQAANGTLTVSPGVYDLGGYIWYPTNLTVMAYGADIRTANAILGLQPVGSFQMIGGSFSNGGWGSVCLNLGTSTNYVYLLGVKMFGLTDTINGTINSDNFTLSVISCELGDNWDVITFAKVSSLSNVVFNCIGSKLYSVTNGESLASSIITPGANQTRVVGCYLEQGLGFTSGAGVLAATANTTNEINGCVIVMRGGLPKVQQASGTVIVDGYPYNASDYKGSINFPSVYYGTNLMPVANAPDFALPVSLFSTNNVVQFQAPTNVDANKKYWQICEVWVTNTTPATPRAIIAPANCKTNGRAFAIPFVTNLSIVRFKVYPGVGTNMFCEFVD